MVGDIAELQLLRIPAVTFVIDEEKGPVFAVIELWQHNRAPQRNRRIDSSETIGNAVPLGLKKLRASMAELRRNSNTLPCNWFVPDLVITSTTAPELRPMSALYRFV